MYGILYSHVKNEGHKKESHIHKLRLVISLTFILFFVKPT